MKLNNFHKKGPIDNLPREKGGVNKLLTAERMVDHDAADEEHGATDEGDKEDEDAVEQPEIDTGHDSSNAISTDSAYGAENLTFYVDDVRYTDEEDCSTSGDLDASDEEGTEEEREAMRPVEDDREETEREAENVVIQQGETGIKEEVEQHEEQMAGKKRNDNTKEKMRGRNQPSDGIW